MARIYRVDLPLSLAEQTSLEAHLTRGVQNAAEAVFEAGTSDIDTIFPAAERADVFGLWAGPYPIELRPDRSGLWRDIYVSPLAKGGDGGAYPSTLRVYLTAGYWPPDVDLDPYVEWVLYGNVMNWQAAKTFVLPRAFGGWDRRLSDGSESVVVSMGWLSFHWTSSVYAPALSGFRMYEEVEA